MVAIERIPEVRPAKPPRAAEVELEDCRHDRAWVADVATGRISPQACPRCSADEAVAPRPS